MWRTGLVAPRHVASSRTRARTHVSCIGRQIPNHCATREVPSITFLAAAQNAASPHSYGETGPQGKGPGETMMTTRKCTVSTLNLFSSDRSPRAVHLGFSSMTAVTLDSTGTWGEGLLKWPLVLFVWIYMRDF